MSVCRFFFSYSLSFACLLALLNLLVLSTHLVYYCDIYGCVFSLYKFTYSLNVAALLVGIGIYWYIYICFWTVGRNMSSSSFSSFFPFLRHSPLYMFSLALSRARSLLAVCIYLLAVMKPPMICVCIFISLSLLSSCFGVITANSDYGGSSGSSNDNGDKYKITNGQKRIVFCLVCR